MSASPENYFHLTVEIVREIHAEAIARFGGSDGVRDSALLESAVAAPQASFGGRSPGNCLVFLRLNSVEPKADGSEWEELVLAIASGGLDREQATTRLRGLLPSLNKSLK